MPTSTRSDFRDWTLGERSSSRTAVYGPVRTVVWEGRGREAPPYPDWFPRSPAYPTLPTYIRRSAPLSGLLAEPPLARRSLRGLRAARPRPQNAGSRRTAIAAGERGNETG